MTMANNSTTNGSRKKKTSHTKEEETRGKASKRCKTVSKTGNDDSIDAEEMEKNNIPWYRAAFTNCDEEYDEYMRTEWGFEKVRRLSFLSFIQILLVLSNKKEFFFCVKHG